MSPNEALTLIDSVLQKIQGTRADHEKIQQAVQVLAQALIPEEKPNNGKPDTRTK